MFPSPTTVLFTTLSLLLLTQIDAEEMPSISEMGDASFKKRESATLKMKSWALGHQKLACANLSSFYFTSKCPETKARLWWVLKEIRMNQPKSYLGLAYKIEKRVDGVENSAMMLHVRKLKGDGPAASGGIQIGDKIISAGGKIFSGRMDKIHISAILSNLPSGKKTVFVVLRDDQKISIHIRPRAKEQKPEDVQASKAQFELWMERRRSEVGKPN